jgi:D-glycero-D-manno-heptose 1,7-bisphosphate phosphatase
MNKALFLDRDGVINVNHGYVHLTTDFEFIDGIFDLVQRANEQGYKVIVVTNQSGIGRGMYTEADFERLSAWMVSQFAKKSAVIDDVLFCPHHPQAKLEQYRQVCECRKPKPGMLTTAAARHDISLLSSIMVGDKLSDMEAAITAGIGHAVWFDIECEDANKKSALALTATSLLSGKTSIAVTHSLSTILLR